MVRKNADELIFEKINYWGKIFIYNDPTWDTLYPVVDIIRILPQHTIIEFKIAKGQNIIKTYGSQYNYRTMGHDLFKKEHYTSVFCKGNILFVFIFTDKPDIFSQNLLNFTEKHGLNVICYSNHDSIYHFYEYYESFENCQKCYKYNKFTFKDPQEVINKMCLIKCWI
jgi:hypothetical protein